MPAEITRRQYEVRQLLSFNNKHLPIVLSQNCWLLCQSWWGEGTKQMDTGGKKQKQKSHYADGLYGMADNRVICRYNL